MWGRVSNFFFFETDEIDHMEVQLVKVEEEEKV